MEMPGLGDPRPEARVFGESIAVDHRDLLEVAGQDPCRQQAGHPSTQHHGVGALSAGGIAAELTHWLLLCKRKKRIGLVVGAVACAWRRGAAMRDCRYGRCDLAGASGRAPGPARSRASLVGHPKPWRMGAVACGRGGHGPAGVAAPWLATALVVLAPGHRAAPQPLPPARAPPA